MKGKEEAVKKNSTGNGLGEDQRKPESFLFKRKVPMTLNGKTFASLE